MNNDDLVPTIQKSNFSSCISPLFFQECKLYLSFCLEGRCYKELNM